MPAKKEAVIQANLEAPLKVPFPQKKAARELGAIFVREEGSRGWYYPTPITEEVKSALDNFQLSLCTFTHTGDELSHKESESEIDNISESMSVGSESASVSDSESDNASESIESESIESESGNASDTSTLTTNSILPTPTSNSSLTTATDTLPTSTSTSTTTTVGMNLKRALQEEDGLYLAWALQTVELPKKAETRTRLLEILGKREAGRYPISYLGLLESSSSFSKEYPLERVMRLLQEVVTGAKPYEEEIRESSLAEEEKALLYFALPLEGGVEEWQLG